MSVRIRLHNPPASYTNLDVIAGSIFLHLQSSTTLSAITIKLEGESRTRLIGPSHGPNLDTQNGPSRPELEVHKLLYKAETVFPTPELKANTGDTSNFTFPPGQYEYPFSLKIPVNNDCMTVFRPPTLGGLVLETVQESNRHIKRTLPPTLSGFPGLAEIKYYLKATAVRPKFYQENLRVIQDFRLLPVEPPRSNDPNNTEVFARRHEKFSRYYQLPSKESLFNRTPSNNVPVDGEPPAFTVDARLPNPAILTCNQSLPLRILVKKTNQSPETLILSTLSIELFSFTNIRAHALTRNEAGSWILTSQSNLKQPLTSSSDSVEKELKIPKRYFESIRLPAAVCPTFEICNIARSYELEIRVGLRHGTAFNAKPELRVVSLRFPVKIYSGIAPPPALLHPTSASAQRPSLGVPASSSYLGDHSPSSTPYAQDDYPPAQTGTYAPMGTAPPYDDAPPTYEEALAEDVRPVDGPRPNYNPPPSPQPPPMPPRSNTTLNGSNPEKPRSNSGIYRMPSERLFPSSTGGSSFPSSSSADASDQDPPTSSTTNGDDHHGHTSHQQQQQQQTGLASLTNQPPTRNNNNNNSSNPFRR